MLMIVAAVCFIVYEIFNAFSAPSHLALLKKFKADEASLSADERSAARSLFIVDSLYTIWTIAGLFYTEWQLIAWCICTISVMRLFLPKLAFVSVIDSLICAGLMTAGVVYIAPTVIVWPPM